MVRILRILYDPRPTSMRKILISLLLFVASIGCDKNEPGNLEFAETIKGGCFLEKGLALKSDPIINSDIATYSVTKGSLNVFVGFNANCFSEYSASSSLIVGSILFKIQTTRLGMRNCIFYFT